MHASSCENERLNRQLKPRETHLTSVMGEEHLPGLAMLKVYHRRANELNLDTVEITFVCNNSRKMFLPCVLSDLSCNKFVSCNTSTNYMPLFAYQYQKHYETLFNFDFCKFCSLGWKASGQHCVLLIIIVIMDKATKQLPAILNYMKKVMLNTPTVFRQFP